VTTKVKLCVMLIPIAVMVITDSSGALPALPELSYGVVFSI
jgi:hypothetical protein